MNETNDDTKIEIIKWGLDTIGKGTLLINRLKSKMGLPLLMKLEGEDLTLLFRATEATGSAITCIAGTSPEDFGYDYKKLVELRDELAEYLLGKKVMLNILNTKIKELEDEKVNVDIGAYIGDSFGTGKNLLCGTE